MKKRGFTLVELLGVIVVLGIIITLAIAGYNRYLRKGQTKAYEVAEKSFKSAAMNAITDCTVYGGSKEICGISTVPEQYEYRFIYLKDLIKSDYIEPIHDPYDSESLCNADTSYVYIINKSDTSKTHNYDLEYKVCLDCGGKYKNDECISNPTEKGNFNINCKLAYDKEGIHEVDNSDWTNEDVYLIVTVDDIEKTKFGITYFEYELNNEQVRGGANNKAAFKLDKTIKDKQIKVTAVDGSGTYASTICPSVKIDKNTVTSAHIVGIETNGKEIDSYDEKTNIWASSDVELTAVTNPSTIPSGYVYEWHKLNDNGIDEVLEISTNKTYLATSSGTYYVKVSNKWHTSEITTKAFVLKIDKTVPVITVKLNPLTLANQDYNFLNNNINYSFGPSGGKASCNPENSKKSGIYTVTCTAKGNNRLETKIDFEVKHSYKATATMRSCRNDKCGKESYNCKPAQSCTCENKHWCYVSSGNCAGARDASGLNCECCGSSSCTPYDDCDERNKSCQTAECGYDYSCPDGGNLGDKKKGQDPTICYY